LGTNLQLKNVINSMQDLVALREQAEACKTSGLVHGYMLMDCYQMIWLLDRLEEAEREVSVLESELESKSQPVYLLEEE